MVLIEDLPELWFLLRASSLNKNLYEVLTRTATWKVIGVP